MRVESRVLGGRVVRVMRVVKREVGGEEGRGDEGTVDDKPRSVYEMLTRRMLEELREDVGEVKGRVNTLLWLVIGAVVLDVLMCGKQELI